MARKKDKSLLWIILGIGALVVLANQFGFLSIFTQEYLIYTDEVSVNGIDYVVKSDTPFGIVEEDGFQLANPENTWTLRTTNEINSIGGLNMNLRSDTIDTGDGGGDPAPPLIRTVAKTKNLNISPTETNSIKIDFNYHGAVGLNCDTSAKLYPAQFRILRIEQDDEELIYQSVKPAGGIPVTQSGTLILEKIEGTTYAGNFVGLEDPDNNFPLGVTLDEGSTYEFQFFTQVNHPCDGYPGGAFGSQDLIIESILINDQPAMSQVFTSPPEPPPSGNETTPPSGGTPGEPQYEPDPFPSTTGSLLETILLWGSIAILIIAIIIFVRNRKRR